MGKECFLFFFLFIALQKNKIKINRDRFVLSNGHACALQYFMLHLSGYEEFTLEQMKLFRQLDSKFNIFFFKKQII